MHFILVSCWINTALDKQMRWTVIINPEGRVKGYIASDWINNTDAKMRADFR